MQASGELDDQAKIFKWFPEEPDVDGSSLTGVMVSAREYAQNKWLAARDRMLRAHQDLETLGLHKQIANRIIEPWFHIQLLVSATEYENFFSLRCHAAAHPDIQDLADQMLDIYMSTHPEPKEPGDLHLPYGDHSLEGVAESDVIKVCVARAARLSYMNFDKQSSIADDIALHDRLAQSGHWSPFEHVATAGEHSHFFGNFRGWHQYRKQFESENRSCDLKALWEERKKLRASKI